MPAQQVRRCTCGKPGASLPRGLCGWPLTRARGGTLSPTSVRHDYSDAYGLAVAGLDGTPGVLVAATVLSTSQPYEQALTVTKRARQPAVWAAAQSNLGAERLATLDRLETLYRSITAIADKAGAQAPGSRAQRSVAVAERLLAHYGAIATPVFTEHGAPLLLVTPGSGRPAVSVVELPRNALADLNQLLFGPENANSAGGWLGAYRINQLPAAKYRARAREWYAAVRDVGPSLWSSFAGKLAEALDTARVPRDASVVWIPHGALVRPAGNPDPLAARSHRISCGLSVLVA